MSEQFANLAQSTLNGAVLAGATSLVLASGAAFPLTGTYTVIVESEFFLVSSRTGNTLAVTPGSEGTTQAAHASGATVTLVETARMMALLQQVTNLVPWQTLVDIDFTAQTTQSLTTDGSYTIAGFTGWTKGNSANETTHLVLTNGTGLVWTPASATDLQGNAAATTSPFLWISLANLGMTTQSWGSKFKVFLSIGADNNAANFDSSGVGIATLPVPGTGIKFGWVGQRGHSTTNNEIQVAVYANNVRTLSAISPASVVVDKTILLTVDRLAVEQLQVSFAGALAAGASFPNENTFKLGNRVAPTVDISASGSLPTDVGLLFYSYRAASPTAYVSTFQRVRIDYQL